MATTHTLKIGIDFGTTYSRVAWAHTATPKKINVIQTWPAGGNHNSDKVPTEIAYLPSGGHKWGFELALEAEKLVWIKLLLEPTTDIAHSPMSQTKKLIPLFKSVVDVISDFLESLKQHTMETLTRKFGKEFLDLTPIDWILAVPAVWSDSTKALMMKAAVAGLGKNASIKLISEPDAAAVCALSDLQPNHLKVDDAFIVADCGGGTVDLMSYQIIALHPKVEIKERAVGTSGMCGSIHINKNFENLVRSRVGPEFDNIIPKGRLVMFKYFEEFLKRTFSDDEDEDVFSCPIPGIVDNPAAGVESGFLVLTREDMRDIFEPVIAEIVCLVQGQIDAVKAQQREGGSEGQQTLDVSAILIIGGFSASDYLRQRLISDLRLKGGAPTYIVRPTDAWSTVVRGAVLRGLEGRIIHTRMARRNYGVSVSDGYYPKRPCKSQGVYSGFGGGPQALDSLYWFIRKGNAIPENQPISYKFKYESWLKWNKIITLELLVSDLAVAPTKSDTTESYLIGQLRLDMTGIPTDVFPRKTLAGRDYYQFFLDLVMTVQGTMLLFEAQFEGKRYGSITINYY